MSEAKEHSWIPKLKQQFADGQIDRREFLRSATLLGLSAGAAYAFVGPVTGTRIIPSAQAAMPQGGYLRMRMRVHEIKDSDSITWTEGSNLSGQNVDYLMRTCHEN